MTLNKLIFFVAVLGVISQVYFRWLDKKRPSKLKCDTPETYAAHIPESGNFMRLRLPLNFRVTGARSVLIQEIKINFPDVENFIVPANWTRFAKTMVPVVGEYQELISPLLIEGYKERFQIVEFGVPFLGFTPELKSYKLQILANVSKQKKISKICEYDIDFSLIQSRNTFIHYQNVTKIPTKSERIKNKMHWAKIIKEFEIKIGQVKK